ncbi:type II toxin-antitoxin system VapC family toxin [Microbacterium sp.]|uniref:type II toxin-antitoxin system VapC family toxin n=1 Tax=Microbacterium sp. TaxID=51671 RepID=UPI0039E4831C
MHYADTSALVKLIVPEQESVALRTWITDSGVAFATSDLARTELRRAILRSSVDAAAVSRARDLLRRITLLALTPELLDRAGDLTPAAMRSLDAIHLASALILGDELEAVVTYDDRMAEAAVALGLPVVAPR